MRRLTTPTHEFELVDFDPTVIKKIKITYAQGDKVVLEKRDNEISIDGNKAVLRLTQEETARFAMNTLVEIQVRILTHDGDAVASNITTISPKKILDDEILV